MKICNSCGGSFDESLPKCPFCGTLNEEGAEKEYNKKLYNIKEELDHVDELAVDDYKNEVRLFFRVFLIALAIACVIEGAIWFSANKNHHPDVLGSRRKELDQEMTAIKSARDDIQNLEELFQSGRYQELCTVFNDSKNRNRFYNWKRYNFISCYSRIVSCRETLATIAPGDDYYKYSNALYSYISAHRDVMENDTSIQMSESEIEIIAPQVDDLKDLIMSKLSLSESELEELEEKASRNSYTDSSVLIDYAKERWGK